MEIYGCQIFLFHRNFRFRNIVGNGNVMTDWEVFEDHPFSKNIRFYRMSLYHEDVEKDEDGSKLITLSTLYEELKSLHGAVIIDYLKICIEEREWKVIPQLIATGLLAKVRQLAIEIHFNVSNTLAECRENIKTIRSIEDYGFIRFSSKINAFSYDRHDGMGIEDFITHFLTWYNPHLKTSDI